MAAIVLVGVGCRELPQAPTELSELSTWLFANFENEDDELLAVGLGNLAQFFDERGVDTDFEDQAWELERMTASDVQDVTHPDREPAAALPVGLVAPSAFAPADHARVVVLEDQTPVEPASPDLYDRSFLEPDDPSCFPPAECALLRTDNDIEKKNLLMSIRYTKRKDFRWSRVILDGEESEGFLARSWFEEEAWGEEEANAILQSYSIDVVLPHGDAGALRYLALWTEASMYGVGDDVILGMMQGGIEDVLVATEAWLEENPG